MTKPSSITSIVLVSALMGCVTANPANPTPATIKFTVEDLATNRFTSYPPNYPKAIKVAPNSLILVAAYAPGGMKTLYIKITTTNARCRVAAKNAGGSINETSYADVVISEATYDAYFDYTNGTASQDQASAFQLMQGEGQNQECTGHNKAGNPALGTLVFDFLQAQITATGQNDIPTTGYWTLDAGKLPPPSPKGA